MKKLGKANEDKAYSQFVWERVNHDYGDFESIIIHAVQGLGIESIEVLDILQKCIRYGEPMPIEKLKKELGDVKFYLRAICLLFGINEDELKMINMKKLLKRCPDGYNPEQHKTKADELE
jgi:NTP pyrophosphatase (non-canonical NTP hydrolase)